MALAPSSSFLMADLVGFLIDRLTTFTAIHEDFTDDSHLGSASLYTATPTKSSTNNYALVFILICANLCYLALMLILLGIYAKIKKERRENQSFCTTLTLEEK